MMIKGISSLDTQQQALSSTRTQQPSPEKETQRSVAPQQAQNDVVELSSTARKLTEQIKKD